MFNRRKKLPKENKKTRRKRMMNGRECKQKTCLQPTILMSKLTWMCQCQVSFPDLRVYWLYLRKGWWIIFVRYLFWFLYIFLLHLSWTIMFNCIKVHIWFPPYHFLFFTTHTATAPLAPKATIGNATNGSSIGTAPKRSLNLEEYKKKKGLIWRANA